MHRRLALTSIGAALAQLACDRAAPTGDGHLASPEGPRYSVNADPAQFGIDLKTHVPGSRRADEEQAIARLHALHPTPEGRRETQWLLDPDNNVRIYVFDDNPEEARLWSLIYAIRDADHHARLPARFRGAQFRVRKGKPQ